MEDLFVALVFIALIVLALGAGPARGLRRASRVVALVGFAFFGLVTLACLYGMIVLDDRGGGVLLFIAVPSGIIAWLFLHAFLGSRETEAFAALPPAEQQARTHEQISGEIVALERRIAAADAGRDRIWISTKKRERLRREAASAREQLAGLRRIEQALSSRKAGDR